MGLLFFLLFLLFAIFSASLEPSPFEVSSMIYIYINIYDGVARFSKVFLFFFCFFLRFLTNEDERSKGEDRFRISKYYRIEMLEKRFFLNREQRT